MASSRRNNFDDMGLAYASMAQRSSPTFSTRDVAGNVMMSGASESMEELSVLMDITNMAAATDTTDMLGQACALSTSVRTSFVNLPAEIRLRIYKEVFCNSYIEIKMVNKTTSYHRAALGRQRPHVLERHLFAADLRYCQQSILLTSRRLRSEAFPSFQMYNIVAIRCNTFLRGIEAFLALNNQNLLSSFQQLRFVTEWALHDDQEGLHWSDACCMFSKYFANIKSLIFEHDFREMDWHILAYQLYYMARRRTAHELYSTPLRITVPHSERRAAQKLWTR
jgi:hypothetical protein